MALHSLIIQFLRCHPQSLLPRKGNKSRLSAVRLAQALDRQVVDWDVIRIAALGEVGGQLGGFQDGFITRVGVPNDDV